MVPTGSPTTAAQGESWLNRRVAAPARPGHHRALLIPRDPRVTKPDPIKRPALLVLALALALPAAPALAAPPVSDSDARALAAIAPPAAGIDAPVVPDRGLMMAGAVNRLLPVQASAGIVAPSADPAEGHMQDLLRRAFALLGTPYRWGGSSPERGFDCSGLVGYVYRTALGIDLPRISRDQAHTGEQVAGRAAMAAGDLVFFGRRGRVDHVGIYIGEGKFVHAPSRGKDVMVSSLDEGYWGRKFMQARRVVL